MFSLTLIFMFSTSAIAQQGKLVKVANNHELIAAKNNPNIQTVVLDEGFYQFYNTYFNQGTIVKFGNNGSRAGDCDYWIQPENYCYQAPSSGGTAVAGVRDAVPGSGLCNTIEIGVWSCPSGDLTWDDGDPTSYIENFTVTAPGAYTLTYTWLPGSGAPPSTDVSTSYKFYSLPVVTLDAPDACGLTTLVTYYIDNGTYPYPIVEDWFLDGTPFTPSGPSPFNLTSTLCGSHTVSVEITQATTDIPPIYGPCSVVTDSDPFFLYDVPVVFAGDDTTICGLTYTLEPTSSASCWGPLSPTTVWSQISGTGTATWDPVDINDVTVDLCGQYVFKVEVFNGLCSATEQVAVYFASTPYNVYAGPDTSICFTSLPFLLTPSYDLDCPNSPTTAWSKVSGPGTVTFSDNDFDATECGDYVLRFTVDNDPCPAVSDDVNIYIYDEPLIVVSPTTVIPSDVCGYLTDDFYLWYTASCENSTDIDTIWTVTPPAGGTTAIITYQGSGLWNILVDWCGDWIFNFEVVNGACSHDTTFTITFHELPDPAISHDGITEITADTVFACSTTTYYALDNRICDITPLTHTWTVSGGVLNTTTGSPVTVTWNNIPGTGSLKLKSEITALPSCADSVQIDIEIELPTLAGQVKYWNEFETYMPTPFPTDINGTYPPDYFYVILYVRISIDAVMWIPLDTVLVEPRLMPDLVELLSYFEFTLPVNDYTCETQFLLKIWDGGLLYDPGFPPNGFNRYLGANYTYNNWDGVNATDALALQKMATNININGAPYNYTWVGPNTLTPPYGYYSKGIADVNNSDAITALDALIANYRAVGLIPKYPSAQAGNMYSPNFEVTGRMVPSLPYSTWSAYFDDVANVDDIPFTHSDEDYQYYDSAVHHKYTSDIIPWEGDNNYINIYYECLGDINASHVPTSGGFKVEPTMELIYEDQLVANQGDVLSIPIRLDNEATMGALTLNLTYMNDLIEVIGTNYEDDFFNINHEEGYVRIGWFGVDPINVKANETIAILELRVLGDIEQGTRLFELDAMTELADPSANRIDGINFKALGVTTDKSALIGTELTANNYPNPFTDKTIISYMLPEAGKVQVVVYSKMGQIVSTIVDQSQDAGTQTVEFSHSDLNAGVYFYKITLNGQTKYYTVTKSMVVVQ